MRLAMRIVIILLAVWLQVAFFGQLRPFGIIPNLVVIVIVLSALLSEATPTVASAVGAGLLLDLASGTDFGLRTAYFVALALAVITARQFGVHGDSVPTLWGLMAAGVVGLDVLLLLSIGVDSWAGHLSEIAGLMGAEVFVTLVLGTLGYLIASNLSRRLPGVSERSPL